MNEGGIPALVHDILESHFGEWFTIDRIVAEIEKHRPDTNPDTIRRAVERMKADGRIEHQLRHRVPARARAVPMRTGLTLSVVRVPWRTYWDQGEEIA